MVFVIGGIVEDAPVNRGGDSAVSADFSLVLPIDANTVELDCGLLIVVLVVDRVAVQAGNSVCPAKKLF